MIKCTICDSTNVDVIYNDIIRSGSFGNNTSSKYSVYICAGCNVKFIEDNLPNDYYTSPEYRQDYNDSVNIEEFYQEYDINDTVKISKIGLNTVRNKVVCDFGAAAGTFLQSINNVAKYTIAVEPTEYFHDTLKKYNKHVFHYGVDLVDSQIKVDIATSFDVLEHISSPKDYLRTIYDSLAFGGKLYLKTPNFDDILHELIPERFDSFNYRTAHLFYFDIISLKYILELIGFDSIKITYLHDYDISNLLLWMKERKPTGLGQIKLFDSGFDLMYRDYLERNGKASSLWVEASKS